jgi:hypothetical protein
MVVMTEETTPDDGVATPTPIADETLDDDHDSRIEEPAKVMRIGGMVKQLLEEVRSAPLDASARTQLAAIHDRSIEELASSLSPDLVAELHRVAPPFGSEDTPPSDAELRIAQAQLMGWLEGLFHGIQTAMVAQQMAAQAASGGGQRRLPPGLSSPAVGPMGPEFAMGDDGREAPWQYL